MLQPAEEGGEFQFAPFIRGYGKIDEDHRCEDEHFEDLQALFDGRLDDLPFPLKGLKAEAGDLIIFNGMRSLHRVTAVKGQRKRIIAVLSYDTKPAGDQNLPSEEVNVLMYGDRY